MHAAPWDSVRCIAKALGEFEAIIGDSWQYDLYCWKQMWPNTACGRGGVAGQAITPAYTVVLRKGNKVYVYHNGQFAGEASLQTEQARACLESQSFPGEADKEAWRAMQ